jgi:5'-3' exonuclease
LVEQLEAAQHVLREMGVAVAVPCGLEADDVLASAARQMAEAGGRTVIVTSDRDSFALIDDHTSVLRIINGGVDASPLLTPERLVTLLGVSPHQYRDFAALRGDASDNLPGVRGIGPKTAAKLLCALGDAHSAFEDLAGDGARVLAAVGPGATARLREPAARVAWELNCAVMTMHVDVPLMIGPRDLGGRLPFGVDAVRRAFEHLQLTWTARTALRVLAHHSDPQAIPQQASQPSYRRSPDGPSSESRPPAPFGPNRWPARVVHPKLPARAVPPAQLSLFD